MKKKKKVHSRFNGSFSEKFAQIRKNSNFSSALKYYNQEHTIHAMRALQALSARLFNLQIVLH